MLVVAVGALGYWRGWFSFNKDGKENVQVDKAKLKQDKEDFIKKERAMKDKVANLGNNTEGLTGTEKAQTQEQLDDLKKQHDRLEKQIGELDDADPDKYESIKQGLEKDLKEVDKKIDDLTKKLEKGKDT